MKKIIPLFILAALLITPAAFADSLKRVETPNQMARAVADAFDSKTMGKLDTTVARRGKIKVVIEHSLSGGDSPLRLETKWFNSFAAIEKWLRSRERDSLPNRNQKPLSGCKNGNCSFNFKGGILHNNLYLKGITYGIYKGRPYVKTIRILDGD